MSYCETPKTFLATSMQEDVTRICGLKCLYYKSKLTWYKSTEVDEDVKIPKSHPVSVQLVPLLCRDNLSSGL